jgi:hypothetical protein
LHPVERRGCDKHPELELGLTYRELFRIESLMGKIGDIIGLAFENRLFVDDCHGG